jgi:L-lactate utilization protein LutB
LNPSTAGPPGTPKGEFLDSVRRALGRLESQAGPSIPPAEEVLRGLEAESEEIRQRAAGGRAALLDKLAKMARLGGWNLYRAPGPEEAIEYLCTLASSLGVRRVVRADQEVFRSALGGPVDAALRNLGLTVTVAAQGEGLSRESLRQEIIEAGLGITGADYAVAETGSVVIVPRKGLSRLVSLVPPVHLALVRPQDVVETLDDLFSLRRLEYYRNGGDMGSYLNFITGPSRTADIEQTLVVGVHGPKEVHLVLLG